MKQSMAAFLLVFALAVGASCARPSQQFVDCPKCPNGIGKLPRQDTVVIRLRMHDKKCKLEQKTPPEIRTDGGSTVRWLFVGACSGQVTLKIEPPAGLFETMSLDYTGPVPAKGGVVELSATMKDQSQFKKGRYLYEVWIDKARAEYNSRADDGAFYACPIWPCGDFQ